MKTKIDLSLTGTICKYFTLALLTIAILGVIYPIMSYKLATVDEHGNYSNSVEESIGVGIITTSVTGGIGMAFFMRRREAMRIKRSRNE